jgi:hypothetical protein
MKSIKEVTLFSCLPAPVVKILNLELLELFGGATPLKKIVLKWMDYIWKGGRVVECVRLEIG